MKTEKRYRNQERVLQQDDRSLKVFSLTDGFPVFIVLNFLHYFFIVIVIIIIAIVIITIALRSSHSPCFLKTNFYNR